MKEIKITIICNIYCLEYCSKEVIDRYNEEVNDGFDAFSQEYYVAWGMEEIQALYVNDNEDENLIKQKGKYVKTKEYFHDLWGPNSDHPLPVELHARHMRETDLHYTIKLEDNEEFDIKKIQFVKSDYEVDCIPYFIIANYILYDGKEIDECGSLCDIGIEGRYCDEYTIDEDNMYD